MEWRCNVIEIGKPQDFDLSALGLRSETVLVEAGAIITESVGTENWKIVIKHDCFAGEIVETKNLKLVTFDTVDEVTSASGANIAFTFSRNQSLIPIEWKEQSNGKKILFAGMQFLDDGVEKIAAMWWVHSHWDPISDDGVEDHWEFAFIPLSVILPSDLKLVVHGSI